MDHGRTAVVQMRQSSGHVLKDGYFCREADVGCVLQKVVQASLQPLHHQYGDQVRARVDRCFNDWCS